jgi:hypothetical protein
MAHLSEQDRSEGASQLARDFSADRSFIEIMKLDFRATFDSVDVWIENNKASFNNALPPAARAALTPEQKARFLVAVAEKRWITGS